MAQQAGGPASDAIRALAEELIPHILGEQTRALEQMQAGGLRLTTNQRHELLVNEIATKIKAVIRS